MTLYLVRQKLGLLDFLKSNFVYLFSSRQNVGGFLCASLKIKQNIMKSNLKHSFKRDF